VTRRPRAQNPGAASRPPDADADPERFLPDAHGPLPAYEHAHRYAFAASVLEGRRVLDLACGAGYGTRILRAAGAEVVALDLDRGCARAAGPPALCGRAERLPLGDASLDAVVCFEAIEHVPEPARVLDEIARVLARSGVAFLSTPDRAIYTERAGNRNPHHVAELDRAEFAALLRERFAHFELYGQSVWAGSWLARLDASGVPEGGGAREVGVLSDPLSARATRTPPPWVDPAQDALPTPLFLVAVCARDAAAARRLRRELSETSVLHDPSQWLLGHYLGALDGLAARDFEIERFAGHARDLQALLAERDERLGKLEHHVRNLEALRAGQDELLEGVRTHARNLEEQTRAQVARLAALEDHARNLEELLSQHGAHLAGTQAHARNLEDRLGEREEHLAGVEAHVRNLEELLAQRDAHLAGVEAHARNLEGLAEGLRRHSANLEKLLAERDAQLQGVEADARNLEALRSAATERCVRLEASLRGLEESRAALEGELGRLRASAWVRALQRLRLVEAGRRR
jgi:SAM-dependent methyltransferase